MAPLRHRAVVISGNWEVVLSFMRVPTVLLTGLYLVFPQNMDAEEERVRQACTPRVLKKKKK
jgi:hypothetical protein